MKKILLAAALVAASASVFAADVGVSINFAQPGLYGRVDIGAVPSPQVVYTRPVIIQPVPVGVVREPLYLYVPPGHQKNWRKHCASYNACGQPVYFVQENWYRNEYVPRYREHWHGPERHEERRDYDRRDDRRGDDRDHGRGHDKDRGDHGDHGRGHDDHGRDH
ncbi:MAG: hypothetical protein V4634_03885 [Pseudomonadota bacterium]